MSWRGSYVEEEEDVGVLWNSHSTGDREGDYKSICKVV